MDFVVWPVRFHLVAMESTYFPEGKAANTIRGALGSLLRRFACVPECTGAKSCEIARECPYALLFEPRQEQATGGPSGLADWPRPFVIRANHLDGLNISSGRRFHFDVTLFVSPIAALPYLVLSFRELVKAGLGASRARAELVEVEALSDRTMVYRDGVFQNQAVEGLRFDMAASEPLGQRIAIRFLTPTELKCEGAVVTRLEFGIFFRRLRDRISNLRSLYQGGPLEIDFEESGRRADEIRLIDDKVHRVNVERLSSRTRQKHPIGGIVGDVEYEGDLSGFASYLRVGEWVGVGRQTVWGKGQFSIL
ncbi:MAG: CRISPR system precrRNA processing endoribonuclease RAMP protein Cas6 [Bryobacteraceae bacterium]